MALTHSTAPGPAQPPSIDDPPLALEETLLRAGATLSDERAREAARLLGRWRSRSFVALIVGEFKRGKSTLLNALIGQDLLPTGVPPVTAVPTRVRSSPRTRAVARFRDGTEREIRLDEIRDYVDESHNPGNRQAVVSVDIEVTAGLPPGVVLVDVPGLGSTHAHNTEAALAALPEADASPS
jgi:ribosome biogenesis GTPase A